MENEEIKKEENKMISYEDFKKVEMKVGEIISAEIVEGADKLYKFILLNKKLYI